MTPIEAKVALAGLNARLIEASAALATAKENLDEAATAVATANVDAISAEAITIAKSLTAKTLSAPRAKTLIGAAAADLSPAQLARIAEASRVSSSPTGITLPAGKYENLSRGRGWCRQGSGAAATWGEKTDDAYRVNASGKWTVGSTDGFNRKDSTIWTVAQIGAYWIAN